MIFGNLLQASQAFSPIFDVCTSLYLEMRPDDLGWDHPRVVKPCKLLETEL